ncbi:MAG: D-sedoheptulose 7-phosphate isomerase [Bacteroidetes bacterium]|nr:D-sedoheptulose 7-phosphate isomerase [Bacteroidota bacterium]
MDIKIAIKESIATKTRLIEDGEVIQKIGQAVQVCINGFKNGKKLYLCGNGGSAADAQHIAAELSGRFNYDRKPLPAEALHVNTSFLTAVANDYDYTRVYSRMVEAFGSEGDVLIGISTSGNSANVVEAMKTAKEQKMTTIGLTGENGGKLAGFSDVCIQVPSDNVARIQESHILIGHILCEEIEKALFPR